MKKKKFMFTIIKGKLLYMKFLEILRGANFLVYALRFPPRWYEMPSGFEASGLTTLKLRKDTCGTQSESSGVIDTEEEAWLALRSLLFFNSRTCADCVP